MKRSSELTIAIMVAFYCTIASAQSIANSNKGFQIGVFDRSVTEFHGGRPEHPVNFIVGQSDPAKDWYADQPSLTAAHAQDQTDLRTIQFSLSSAPAPVYRLHISLVLPGRAVPALRVSINGKSGTFYLQSKLNSTLGGMDDAFETAYVPADVSFDFPGAYLHQGSNTIGFQVIKTGEPTGLPDPLVESRKTAEDGRGTILRLLDLGGSERTVNVESPLLQLSKAVQTDAVERDQQPLPLVDVHGFKVTVHPHEIVTVRMISTPGTDSAASDRTAESSKHSSLEK